MRLLFKKCLLLLPQSITRAVVHMREWWWRRVMQQWERRTYPSLPSLKPHQKKKPKNILIYAINGLTHAGTEKNLQLIANTLAPTYQVFFMHGDKVVTFGRKESLDSRIRLIPFSYTQNEISVPHRLTGMHPHLKEVIAHHDIDVMITASPGYAHYPWNTITEIPIVLLNIFGAPTLQRNIDTVIYNSQTTRDHAAAWIGKNAKDKILYAPLASLPPQDTRASGRNLRHKLGIPDADFVFGRIGRDSDAIFDPIGIRAWKKIVMKYPHAHYLVMSPPPLLVKMVEEENIPRVHFLPPSGKEPDVWAFHGALDCFAHFRLDGETSGVAIAESLTVGNPVVTHRSHIWNAHLEYLTSDFARIAPLDNSDVYAEGMEDFIALRTNEGAWHEIQGNARACGERNFSPERYGELVRQMIYSLHA